MPLPPDLQAAFEAAGTFNPLKERKLYTDHKALWRLYLDLLELDANRAAAMLKQHGQEPEEKYKLRQELVVAFNLVPMIVGIICQYLYSEEPTFDVKEDPDLEAFLADCDGRGTDWASYVRETILPSALVMGWTDLVVTNPSAEAALLSQADAEDLRPRVRNVPPIKRPNWSCDTDDAYLWMTYQEPDLDPISPFDQQARPTEQAVTLAAAGTLEGADPSRAAWFRFLREEGKWVADGDYCPTARVPVATLYATKSVDPDRRHWGVTKMDTIGPLTKKIINLLSWVDEDVLANLALLSIPTKDGREPKNENGEPLIKNLGPFSIVYYDGSKGGEPSWVQGNVSHIEAKLKLIGLMLEQILSAANLDTVEGGAQTTSGLHAVVKRNELFQELSTLAGALDTLTLEVFALVKSWRTGVDWDLEKLREEIGPVVNFNKSSYTSEPLDVVIEQKQAVIKALQGISQTGVKMALKDIAKSAFYQHDPELEEVLKEIEEADPDMALGRIPFGTGEELGPEGRPVGEQNLPVEDEEGL